MADQHSNSLLRPLLPTAASSSSTQTSGAVNSSSSTSTIFLRLLFILSLGSASLWANHEASKGFQIQIINDAVNSPAGKRFALFYASNDRATSILLNASNFAQHLLFHNAPNADNRNPIRRVTLRLAADNSNNLTATGASSSVETVGGGEFVIRLSPSLMMISPAGSRDTAIKSAVLRAMTFVWLWDGGEFGDPAPAIEAAVECVIRIAGFGDGGGGGGGGLDRRRVCWGETADGRGQAEFLEFCERRWEGFLRRLNQRLRSGWEDRTAVEGAAGMPMEKLCESYRNYSSHVFSHVDL